MELSVDSTIATMLKKFNAVRQASEVFCGPLEAEDFSAQPAVFVSPPKWHLAHTTWFFEQFILVPMMQGYQVYNDDFAYLFNSYYNNAGDRVLRPNRGLMTRPSVDEVLKYRYYVTEKINDLAGRAYNDSLFSLLEIGINHEQQHQELLAYDIKYLLGHQPTFPIFDTAICLKKEPVWMDFVQMEEGLYHIGHRGEGFCFDNELAHHKVFLGAYEIANRLVTNGEYMAFMEAGGYQDFNWWHSDGWDFIQKEDIRAPLYWHKIDGKWYSYNYDGLKLIDQDLPVSHISYYEAFAFASWKGMRLPTEQEWEAASPFFPWGQLWEWTGSAYLPYPGFKKAPGALGEYNGKFMVNQHVLRGASAATPAGHSRNTYRNFFHPEMRWMFAGIRLVK